MLFALMIVISLCMVIIVPLFSGPTQGRDGFLEKGQNGSVDESPLMGKKFHLLSASNPAGYGKGEYLAGPDFYN